jgi:putative colanic acid biosynthesis UDP-glucose lipid carrier transferase
MLLIALAIKLTSRGPVLFKQPRHGEGGREFNVLKFRSMRVMETGSVVTQAQRSDPRVTPVGAFLRKSSLDELPQFLNVVLGDMSLVGPRPHAVAHNELYRTQILEYMRRCKVKPGITGWAQVNGLRGETDTLEKMVARVDHDLAYIRHWSLWFDIKIIFLTVFGRKVRQNAY